MQEKDAMKCKTDNRFAQTAIVVMVIIFAINLFVSDGNLFWILLSGGGKAVDDTGVSYSSVFRKFQLFRLVTYGYTQTAVWHLAANLYGLWYVSLYLEKKLGSIWFAMVYHIGLIIAGIVLIVLYPDGLQCGASPAIFACFGVLANWLVKNRELWGEYKVQKGYSYLLYYFILSNLMGMSTFVFHFIGFAVGFLLGFIVRERAS